MKFLKLIIKNSFRHRLRTFLTILGLAVVVMSFGIVRNVLESFSPEDDDIIPGHMISRNKASYLNYMPLAHVDKMREVEGVEAVTYSFWVGYRYGKDQENSFMRWAVDPDNFAKVRKDWLVPDSSLKAFQEKKNAALVTPALALSHDLEKGKHITVGVDYFEGVEFNLEVVGLFEFKNEDLAQLKMMLFRGDLFRQTAGAMVSPEIEHQVGMIELLVDPPGKAAEVGKRIDSIFANSDNQTQTSSVNAIIEERLARFSTIINALKISSYLMIVVILLVLLNTMSMVARERIGENAVLKTLGFRGKHLFVLNFGESLFVGLLGGILGAALIWPGIRLFKQVLPFLQVEFKWIVLAYVGPAVVLVGILASLFPVIKALRTSIIDGLRTVE